MGNKKGDFEKRVWDKRRGLRSKVSHTPKGRVADWDEGEPGRDISPTRSV